MEWCPRLILLMHIHMAAWWADKDKDDLTESFYCNEGTRSKKKLSLTMKKEVHNLPALLRIIKAAVMSPPLQAPGHFLCQSLQHLAWRSAGSLPLIPIWERTHCWSSQSWTARRLKYSTSPKNTKRPSLSWARWLKRNRKGQQAACP